MRAAWFNAVRCNLYGGVLPPAAVGASPHSAPVWWGRRTASRSGEVAVRTVSLRSTNRTATVCRVGVSFKFPCRIRIQMFSAVRWRERAARNGRASEPTRALHSSVRREKAQLSSRHPARSNMDLGFTRRSGTFLWLSLLLCCIGGTLSKGEHMFGFFFSIFTAMQIPYRDASGINRRSSLKTYLCVRL